MFAIRRKYPLGQTATRLRLLAITTRVVDRKSSCGELNAPTCRHLARQSIFVDYNGLSGNPDARVTIVCVTIPYMYINVCICASTKSLLEEKMSSMLTAMRNCFNRYPSNCCQILIENNRQTWTCSPSDLYLSHWRGWMFSKIQIRRFSAYKIYTLQNRTWGIKIQGISSRGQITNTETGIAYPSGKIKCQPSE